MKSQTYPETIPAQFAQNEILSTAYRKGWQNGHGLACHNVPTLGAKLLCDSLGRVTVDAENIREVHEASCFSAEMNSRDFSPFEFTAREFNNLDDETENVEDKSVDNPGSDAAWEAYNVGVADSIRADLATYDDEAYGIVTIKDKDGKPLEIGDSVTMPAPNGTDDAWKYGGFLTQIVGTKPGLVTVEDADGDCFDVEPERTEKEE